MPTKNTIMIIGLGDLGRNTLEILARNKNIQKILVASRNQSRGEKYCNLARLGARLHDHDPEIRFTQLDLNNIPETAEALHISAPDIVLCTASLMTWWLTDLFPEHTDEPLKKLKFGAWLPIHLTLPIKLMQAVKIADIKAHILSAPFPDVVNNILGKINLAPTCGVGNIDEIVPKIQYFAANKLNVSPSRIKVNLVAHHALEAAAFTNIALDHPRTNAIPPYLLEIYFDNQNVTNQVEGHEIISKPYPLPNGPAWNLLTASSTNKLINALIDPNIQHLHAPGPLGLPGGYPLKISQTGVELNLGASFDLEEAIKINELSHPFDGIETIESDGTVKFTPETTEILKKSLRYDSQVLHPMDAENKALELVAKFREYANNHGVHLPSS